MRDRPNIAGFAYHDVTDSASATGFQRPGAMAYKLPVATFRRHLQAIADGGRHPSLVTDVDFLREGQRVVLTFDDGGVSALTAAGELARYGWKAHFFVTTGRLGTPGFLDATGVRALHTAGHIVGSHSHSHPDIFRELPASRMHEEWRSSLARLAEITGVPCETASVPGGDASTLVCHSAARAGVRFLFTSDPTLEPRQVDDCIVLGRFCPKVQTGIDQIRRLARFETWGRALLMRRLKELARRALPPVYRAYVQRTTDERARGGR